MKCNLCGNTRHFLAEVKEFRVVDADHPKKLDSFVIPIVVNCSSGGCVGSSLSGQIEFDPIPAELVSFTEAINTYRSQNA